MQTSTDAGLFVYAGGVKYAGRRAIRGRRGQDAVGLGAESQGFCERNGA